jgi:Skp family chaperone for outer membrane proteins
MEGNVKPLEQEPAIGISFQVQAGVGTLTFQTHMPQTTSKEDLDGMVDKFEAVCARQAAKGAKIELEKSLKQQEAQLKNMREDRARIEALLVPQEGRRNNQRQLDEIATKRSQADATEKRLVEIITEIRQQIADCDKVIAGT